jgi:hypothetical protein
MNFNPELASQSVEGGGRLLVLALLSLVAGPAAGLTGHRPRHRTDGQLHAAFAFAGSLLCGHVNAGFCSMIHQSMIGYVGAPNRVK